MCIPNGGFIHLIWDDITAYHLDNQAGTNVVNPIINHPQNSPQMGSNPSPNGRWIGIGFSMVFHTTDHSLLTHWHHRSKPRWKPLPLAWPAYHFLHLLKINEKPGESNRYSTYSAFILPSGKRFHSYGKSPCLIGKSTISMGRFPVRYVTNCQGVHGNMAYL